MDVYNKKTDNRNYGIDVLRIISMFYVVMLHCLGHGGIIYNATVNSMQYKTSWLIEIICYCAVNIFALISGYVAYSNSYKKTNFSNYVTLWLEVVFYGILVTIVFDVFNLTSISIKDYIIALFPVTFGLYWYFTAYTGLFLIIPLINNAIRNTNEKILKYFFLILLFVFSMFDSITNRFVLNSGYSFIWLLLLFIVGSIIKKCQIGKNIKNYKIFCVVVIMTIITYLYKIYGFDLSIKGIEISKDLFVSYTSPTILIIAIMYVIFFSRITFSEFNKKIIRFVIPSAFAIYILNNHRLIWNNVINNLFVKIANSNVIKVILYPIIFSICFVIIVIIIDKIRQYIFKRLNIKKYVEKGISLVFKL